MYVHKRRLSRWGENINSDVVGSLFILGRKTPPPTTTPAGVSDVDARSDPVVHINTRLGLYCVLAGGFVSSFVMCLDASLFTQEIHMWEDRLRGE